MLNIGYKRHSTTSIPSSVAYSIHTRQLVTLNTAAQVGLRSSNLLNWGTCTTDYMGDPVCVERLQKSPVDTT